MRKLLVLLLISILAIFVFAGCQSLVPSEGEGEGEVEEVTVNIVGNGIVTKDPAGPTYATNTLVTLDPTADDGWTFTGWSGANAGDLVDNEDGTWTINMDANKTVTATFEIAVNDGPDAVDLGTSGNFVILSKAGISNTGSTTSITGDIGVSPIPATAITGFGLIMDSSGEFATSALVTGNVYAADYSAPTPANMTTAISDMETAYTDAAGRTDPTATELGAGNISGMTLPPGLYKWSTGVSINTNVTLSGDADGVWIFQIAGNLSIASAGTVASGIKVLLAGEAQASNIFWQVAGGTGATLGTYSTFEGTILSATQIIIETGAELDGRALAQTQVTLDQNMVTSP